MPKKIPSHTGGGRPLSSRPEGPGTAFANFLVDYLPHTSLTNEEIAAKMGYARPNIVSMWKTARTKVTLDAVYGLSELLKVDLAYLMALYFEQYVADEHGGTTNFQDIVKMMSRITTPAEWEIIEIVREARKFNDMKLRGDQKSALKKLFAAPKGIEEGPLTSIELEFFSSRDRRKSARRGHPPDMNVGEIEEESSRKADTSRGSVRKAGRRATKKTLD